MKIVATGIMVFLAGIALLYVGGLNREYWKTHQGLQALVNNLGALLVISVALSVVWELVGKRAFARELLETARTAAEVEAAGLRRIVTDYLMEPDWEDLFRSVRNLDIFVAYGQTWRNNNLGHLQLLAGQGDSRIHVYLPDPDDKEIISVLARRFGTTAAELVKRITDTKADFENLRVPGKAAIEVFYYRGDRLFSFYIFDGAAVITLYKHKQGRTPMVPTLVCRAGGSLYGFIHSELAAVGEQSRPA
ncbi:MAG: hypothetical protein M3Y33_06850 [Actinomycetota bacterium]|nr:hypothetical protein [Actinomycetota bacterium]